MVAITASPAGLEEHLPAGALLFANLLPQSSNLLVQSRVNGSLYPLFGHG